MQASGTENRHIFTDLRTKLGCETKSEINIPGAKPETKLNNARN